MISRLFVFLFLAFLVACSNSSNSGGGDKGGNNGTLTPDQRWPETGSFRYHFKMSGMENCEVDKSFGKKSEYCTSLTDDNLNNSCALEARKSLYKGACGDDFSETNIQAPWLGGGYDQRLQKQCRTADATSRTFPNLADYCQFLKDENLHQNCMWDSRKARFEKRNCVGQFSPEPTPVAPPHQEPAPQPTPPQPAPQPPVDARPQVIKDLEAAGIEVRIENDNYEHLLPGEKSFRESLPGFLAILENYKFEIIRRKNQFNKLRIATYASHDKDIKSLALCVHFKDYELNEYLKLLDQVTSWEMRFNINFEGIDVYYFQLSKDKDQLLDFRNFATFLTNKEPMLQGLKGTVRKIEFNSFSKYYFGNRDLIVRRDYYQQDMINFATELNQLAPFYQWADNQQIEIYSNDFDLYEKSKYIILDTVHMLEKNREHLMTIKRTIGLKKIDIAGYSDAFYFSEYSGEMSLIAKPNFELNEKLISALAYQGHSSELLKIPIKNNFGTSKIGSEYLTAIDRLKNNLNLIQNKKSLISEINLSYTSSYSYKKLYIGYSDKESDLQKIIRDIH